MNATFFLGLFLTVGCDEAPSDPAVDSNSGDTDTPNASDGEELPGPEDIELSISTPLPGSWTTEETVSVSGTVDSLTDLTVNGEPATVDGNTWTASVPATLGVVPIEVRGIDESDFAHVRRRSVLAGSFDPDTAHTGNVMRMRLNRGAIDRGLEEIPEMFSAEEVETWLLQDPRIYGDAWVWLFVTGVDYDTPVFDIELSEGALHLSLTLPNLEMTFWYDSLLDGEAYVSGSAVRVAADVALQIEEGELSVGILSASVEIDDFYFEMDNSLGIEHLMQDAIQTAFEDAMEEALISEVTPVIEETFQALDLSFSDSLLGTEFSVDAAFAELAIDDAGIELLVEVSLEVHGSEQTAHLDGAPGWFAREFEPDALSHTSDVAVALSDNLLNHLLFGAWAAALLTDDLSTFQGTLSGVFLSLAGATEGSLSLDALLPPVVLQSADLLEVQIGEIIMEIDTPGAPLGEHVKLVIGGVLPLDLVLDDAVMLLSVGNPDVHLDASENDWVMRPEEIEMLLVDGLPLDLVTELASGIEIPIPTYEGVSVTGGEISRDSAGSATRIEFDID